MENAYKYILNDLGLKDGDVVVAGISGGPDSMALLHLLIRVWRELIRKGRKISIVCAHVNHKVRKESDDEEIFVKEYCEKNKVIFECYHIEEYGNENFHKDARDKRYNFYEELVNKYQARFLFTAHHGDDLVETILMRLTRGSNLKGYSGFSKIVDMGNYKIVRPLIELTKQEIAEYDDKNGIEYAIDQSNFKDDYTRNRFRKYMLPLLKKEDKNVHLKFYKFSNMLEECNEYIDKIVNEKLGKIYVQDKLNISEFLKEEHIIQIRILYFVLEKVYGNNIMLINDRHTEALFNLFKSEKGNASICFPNNIFAIKEYNNCFFIKDKEINNNYKIEIRDLVSLSNGKNIEKIKETGFNSNNICKINSSDVKLPLYVRNRINGDKMSVKGLNGRKKINDIFIDNKIPLSERETWPVVVDSENTIIWLPGLKKSKLDKTNDEKYDIILKYY